MSEEIKEENDENIHYISDQGSEDEKPEIESIIKQKTKIFENESIAIKILLSEHYRAFRNTFFQEVKTRDKSVFQEIKKQIRNLLNTYRIFLNKEKQDEIPTDLEELSKLLRAFYKDSYFNNVFFVNYFKDIRELNKMQKKYIYNYPKNEMETLNDIERKVKIIKDLKYYLNSRISDRIQINYDSRNVYCTNPYSELKFNYLVIEEEEFSKMEEIKLKENISDSNASNKLRRPISSYITYNYLPILCKGSCLKEAKEFNDNFSKWLINHINSTGCNKCIDIRKDINIIQSQIKSLYIKTCIFSHNINEIMFHPLILFTMESFDHFYQKQLKKTPGRGVEKLVRTNVIPALFRKGKYETQYIYNPAQEGMKAILNKLFEYSKKNGLYIECCYKNEIKTKSCPIKFNPNNPDYFTHEKKCPYYHSNLERRRIYKIIDNEICKNAIENGGWVYNLEEKIPCNNGDNCYQFHTRNELFFDKRYYRKLYPCTEAYYCEKGDLCPRKHATDININEIFLPKEYKEKLKKYLDYLKIKDEKIKNELKSFKIIQCDSCLNFIDGIQQRNMIYFLICHHRICTKCYSFYKSCPLCGFNTVYNQNEEKYEIEIILDYKLPKHKKVNSKKDKDESEEKDESNSKIIKEKFDEDNDIQLPEENFSFHNNSSYRPKNRFYSNNNSYNNNNYNNKYYYNNNRSFRGRERRRGRGLGGGRGRGGNSRGWPIYEDSSKDQYDNNGNYYNNENDENENYIKRRVGKGIVRGSKRKTGNREVNNFDNYENKNYVQNDENESSANIGNLEESEESKNKEGESYNIEDEFSMRQENDNKKQNYDDED